MSFAQSEGAIIEVEHSCVVEVNDLELAGTDARHGVELWRGCVVVYISKCCLLDLDYLLSPNLLSPSFRTSGDVGKGMSGKCKKMLPGFKSRCTVPILCILATAEIS